MPIAWAKETAWVFSQNRSCKRAVVLFEKLNGCRQNCNSAPWRVLGKDEIVLFGSATFLSESWTWWIMKVTMTCIVLVWNYIGRKLFIFRWGFPPEKFFVKNLIFLSKTLEILWRMLYNRINLTKESESCVCPVRGHVQGQCGGRRLFWREMMTIRCVKLLFWCREAPRCP